MSRSTSPENVHVYEFGDDFNATSKYPRMPYEKALEVVQKKRGRWWNRHRTKLILFPAPPASLSFDSRAALNVRDMEAVTEPDISRERLARIEEWNPAKRKAVA